jgi:hypothetical protein
MRNRVNKNRPNLSQHLSESQGLKGFQSSFPSVRALPKNASIPKEIVDNWDTIPEGERLSLSAWWPFSCEIH